MKIQLFFVQLFIIIFITACSKTEICPEHQETLACDANTYFGLWEFVAYENELAHDACLSSINLNEPRYSDILIEEPEEYRDNDLKFRGFNYLDIEESSICKAIPTSINPWYNLIFDVELLLKNPNHLVVIERNFTLTDRKVYRKKE